jgi:hypothetical protein
MNHPQRDRWNELVEVEGTVGVGDAKGAAVRELDASTLDWQAVDTGSAKSAPERKRIARACFMLAPCRLD